MKVAKNSYPSFIRVYVCVIPFEIRDFERLDKQFGQRQQVACVLDAAIF